jgi:hypothetical protein
MPHVPLTNLVLLTPAMPLLPVGCNENSVANVGQDLFVIEVSVTNNDVPNSFSVQKVSDFRTIETRIEIEGVSMLP